MTVLMPDKVHKTAGQCLDEIGPELRIRINLRRGKTRSELVSSAARRWY